MKGILFTQDNIRLIREGKKTQTRRLMKFPEFPNVRGHEDWHAPWLDKSSAEWVFVARFGLDTRSARLKSRYLPGELVYVKEAWRSWCIDGRWAVRYKLDNAVRESVIGADENTDDYYFVEHEEKWESPMFLSECFARTFLRIQSVRPERLQDISEDDCYAEGIEERYEQHPVYGPVLLNPIDAYHSLWDSINKPPHDWAANDWVWVISFSPEPRAV